MNAINEITVKQDQSPVGFMNKAIAGGLDIEKIEKMLELQAKWDAMEAKKAYTAAMAAFKAMPLRISKDKENRQYNSRYTSIGNLVNSVIPGMGECGLSHKWSFSQDSPEIIIGTCTVTHKQGHSESISMSAPIDVSGKKNPLQQLKSTRTYLRIETFESIMGLASSDGNLDDDGNAAGARTINEKQLSQIVDLINANDVDEKKFLEWANVDRVENLLDDHFNKYVSALQAKVEK